MDISCYYLTHTTSKISFAIAYNYSYMINYNHVCGAPMEDDPIGASEPTEAVGNVDEVTNSVHVLLAAVKHLKFMHE